MTKEGPQQGMSFPSSILAHPLRGTIPARLCEAVRSRLRPYWAPLELGREVAAFLGLGETWLEAPGNLAEIVTRECPDYVQEADGLRQRYHGRCITLEHVGTPEALNHRVMLGRSLVERVTDAMSQHLEGDYRYFEVENNGVHWFDPQPRQLEATRSLVGIFEVAPEGERRVRLSVEPGRTQPAIRPTVRTS